MYNDDLFNKQRIWSEKSLFLMRELLPLMAPVAQYDGWSNEERETLGFLLSATARASESVMLLCAYGQLWDAELIGRSVLEGSLKFIYLLQSRDDFKQRYTQYSEDLFNIGLLKDHQKTLDLLNASSDPDAAEWKPFREKLLSDEEVASIKSQCGKSERRALEAQWGFTGLIGALTKLDSQRYASIAMLAHGYSTASHIQHADYIGVSIPIERDLRTDERRNSIHLAHMVRLISDIFSFFYLRLSTGYRYINHDPTPLQGAREKIDRLQASFGDVYGSWMSSEYKNDASESDNQQLFRY
ncbi:MAG: DUF5677 domain-containing protein [Methylotenera sp.]|nr:DUF5677 domain-containing protein [Methylotenera sp.]